MSTATDTRPPAANGSGPYISAFQNAMSTDPAATLSLGELVDGIAAGRWRKPIEAARAAKATGNTDRYAAAKKQLPAVTLSGTFSARRADGLLVHSGLMQVDLDHISDPAATRDQLASDPHIAAAFISPGGDGVKAVAMIDGGRHAEAFQALAAHMRRRYGLDIDPAVKDPARLCFVSYDPDARYNPDARPLPITPARPLTDLGNAERIYDWHGHRLRYSAGLGWLVWDGTRWARNEAAARRAGAATVREIYHEALAENDQDKRATLMKHGVKSEGAARIEAALKLARDMIGIETDPAAFDAAPDALNTPGGILHLPSGEAERHRPAAMHRHIAGAAPAGACPQWQAFINRIFDGNAELIAYVQEAAGYSLTGRTSEQCFFFAWGTGANGKSTFCNVLLAAAGEYGQKLPSDSLMLRYQSGPTNDIAALAGARLVVASEVQAGARLNEGLVKDLTGGDTLSARFLYGEYFTFRPALKLWIYGNHKPTVKGTDYGIWRRVRLIPFTVTIPEAERDPHLEARLLHELPGIMAWAAEGARRWYQRGGRLPDCAAVTLATAEYQAESDLLAAFFEDCCVIEAHCSARASELYAAYTAWCSAYGEHPLSGTRLGRELAARGFAKRKSSTVVWDGIGLLGE